MNLHRPVRRALGVSATLVMVAVVAASQPGTGTAPPVRDVVITVDAGPDPATADPFVTPSVSQARQVAHDPRQHRVTASAIAHLDLPVAAVGAYRAAAMVMREVDPDCGLSWSLLAAIGRVETDHGRYAGATLGSDGRSTPLIRGVALDGTGLVARIRDTDAGTVDGDQRWDRAVGPMQFLPSTWTAVGVDADGDGVRSADDLDDAALGAAVFLCAASGDLDTLAGRRAAVLRYNPSATYAHDVLAVERAYRSGDYTLPELATYGEGPRLVRASAPAPATIQQGSGGETRDHGEHAHAHAHAEQVTHAHAAQVDPTPTPGPATEPTPDPTPPPAPAPTPAPTPDPAPEPAPTQELTGVLATCGTEDEPAWCLDDLVVDVGDEDLLAATALADFDGDDTIEANAEELTGLAGTEITVTVTVPEADEAPVLLAIGEDTYLPEDPAEPRTQER